jgi:hypothetical protein
MYWYFFRRGIPKEAEKQGAGGRFHQGDGGQCDEGFIFKSKPHRGEVS